MKGFIEVTLSKSGLKVLINPLNHDFTQQSTGCIVSSVFEWDNYFLAKESYEEIKQLIEQAQKD